MTAETMTTAIGICATYPGCNHSWHYFIEVPTFPVPPTQYWEMTQYRGTYLKQCVKPFTKQHACLDCTPEPKKRNWAHSGPEFWSGGKNLTCDLCGVELEVLGHDLVRKLLR